MKSITRLSLALIMFSLFSISYLVTSVSAQDKGEAAKDVDIIKDVVQIEEAAETATMGDATEVPSAAPSLLDRVKSFLGIGTTDIAP